MMTTHDDATFGIFFRLDLFSYIKPRGETKLPSPEASINDK